MSNDYVFDIETYPNVFTLAVEHADAPLRWMFEISDWRNDSREIVAFLLLLKESSARMVGFNNLGFDYPILHMLIRMGCSDAKTLYQKAQSIIASQDGDESRWIHLVKLTDQFVTQLDLFKIHHFDNKARSTSLKALEFNMRADNIEDLPFEAAESIASFTDCDEMPECPSCVETKSTMVDPLRALATATPEQLLGIVGAVDVHRRMMLVSGGHHEPNGTIVLDGPSAVFHRKVDYYIVTPREGA